MGFCKCSTKPLIAVLASLTDLETQCFNIFFLLNFYNSVWLTAWLNVSSSKVERFCLKVQNTKQPQPLQKKKKQKEEKTSLGPSSTIYSARLIRQIVNLSFRLLLCRNDTSRTSHKALWLGFIEMIYMLSALQLITVVNKKQGSGRFRKVKPKCVYNLTIKEHCVAR